MNLSKGSDLADLADLSTAGQRYEFTVPLKSKRDCYFSFSGLKTFAQQCLDKVQSNHNMSPDSLLCVRIFI